MKKLKLAVCVIWKRLKNWAIVRGQYVGVLWIVIGLIGFVSVKYIQAAGEERVIGKLKEFADPVLPCVLLVGAIITTGLVYFLMKPVSSTWPDRTADEVSSATTHFAMISCVIFLWQSISGSPQWQALLVPLAMLVAAVWFCPFEPSPVRAEDYGVKFTMPEENALVENETMVRGTAQKEPPHGYELWLVRRWGGHDHEFYPVDRIQLSRTQDSGSFAWTVRNALVGGRAGMGETRKFEVWIVGYDGQCLIKSWYTWNNHYSTYRSDPRFSGIEMLSRAIEGETKDMVRLAQRVVERK